MTVSIAAPGASVGVGKTQLMTDPAVLAKVAEEDREPDVRKAAVKKLRDQAVLAEVAVEDKSTSVREAARSRLRTIAP